MADVHHLKRRWRDRHYRNERPNPHRLYRDTEHAILAGVCAGIANYWGWGRCGVRMVFILLMFTGFLVPFLVVGYLLLAFLLPKKPADIQLSSEQEEFWRGVSTSPATAAGSLRHRFRDLDMRLQRMEAHVTSSQFAFDRELNSSPN